jgi:hypothetical protein
MSNKMDEAPSRADQMASKAKERFEKLSIRQTKIGSFIQRALGGISTSIRQTGGRNLEYPEVATISQSCLLYTLGLGFYLFNIDKFMS